MVRLPQEYAEVTGKYANVYAVDSSHFLIEIVDEENPKGNFKTQPQKHKKAQNKTEVPGTSETTGNLKGCGGRDLNPRTPAGPDPESGTFDLAR